ncbi:hypothetical protein HP550_20385 [Cellulomonas humilata]|uniref:Uncharacterized protein n=1 Tax=Cellulomonas humilata TaxID=144055 RepID=A0A7Y6A6X4_9CELL|nr:hypothetical protein [Cellulomonas humilata]NUU19609.1 hypothetical protein [Cellulomonas humilata]
MDDDLAVLAAPRPRSVFEPDPDAPGPAWSVVEPEPQGPGTVSTGPHTSTAPPLEPWHAGGDRVTGHDDVSGDRSRRSPEGAPPRSAQADVVLSAAPRRPGPVPGHEDRRPAPDGPDDRVLPSAAALEPSAQRAVVESRAAGDGAPRTPGAGTGDQPPPVPGTRDVMPLVPVAGAAHPARADAHQAPRDPVAVLAVPGEPPPAPQARDSVVDDSDTTPYVVVEIGRLEVTVPAPVAPPAPTSSVSAARRPKLGPTLTDYLAGRAEPAALGRGEG